MAGPGGRKHRIGLRDAVAIGIGGMVGGGISTSRSPGFLLCLASLVILLGQQYIHNLGGAAAASGLIAVAYALEWHYKRVAGGDGSVSGGQS